MPCNHWDGLTSFLDDRRILLDTNIVERGIRPIVHECKNALFAAMTRRRTGPATAGPQAYFADVLTRLINLWPASRLDELMPWTWTAKGSDNRLAA